MKLSLRHLLIPLLLLLSSVSHSAPKEYLLPLNDGGELSILQFPAQVEQAATRYIWMPTEHGLQPAEVSVAEQLAKLSADVEVLIPDYFTSFFLPAGKQALNEVAARSLQSVLKKYPAPQAGISKQDIFIVAPNKAAIPAMQALHAIQTTRPAQRIGLILLNPDVTNGPPIPGVPTQYHPIVSSTNAPVFIIQAEKSPWRHGLFKLESTLEKSGSDVFLQVLPDVRDRFYFRPDASEKETAMAQRLPRILAQAANLLAPYLDKERSLPSVSDRTTAEATERKPKQQRKRGLSPYTGAQGKSFSLPDLEGTMKSLQDWRGKVVLLNFWASWCPPCVHEIPSMVALKNRLKGRPFEIVAVNLGEPVSDVRHFLSQHPVNFPVLLDSRGETAKSWQVAAYPTSFIIDRDGRIRLALAGGHDWDEPESVDVIEKLLNEAGQ